MKTIALSRGMVATVDDQDYARLSEFTWRILHKPGSRRWYAQTEYRIDGKGQRFYAVMHRVILNVLPGIVIDHIDGDGLNNTRANLRICDASDNNANTSKRAPEKSTSKYKGVWKGSDRQVWTAKLSRHGRIVYRGSFETEIEAAHAYDRAVLQFCPGVGRLNFPAAPDHSVAAQLLP